MARKGIRENPCCSYCENSVSCRKIKKALKKHGKGLQFPDSVAEGVCSTLKYASCGECGNHLKCAVEKIEMGIDTSNTEYWQQGWHAYSLTLTQEQQDVLDRYWEQALNEYEEPELVTPRISFIEGYTTAKNTWEAYWNESKTNA